MSKGRFIGLSGRLLLAAALAMGLALALFTATLYVGYSIIDRKLSDEAFLIRAENTLYDNLQSRIDYDRISAMDTQAVTELSRSAGVYAMYLIRDGIVIFDSQDELTGKASEGVFEDAEVRELRFADGDAEAVVYADPVQPYYMFIYTLAWAIAAIGFIALFTVLIRRRIRYILVLESEMHVLEGGDLRHEIPVTGSDELALLAGSINEMRQSVLERQEAQERAEAAGRGLVASMSHDLRTPLTSLIGYLELATSGKYEDDACREHFERCALDKAYRIKAMTDELFRYALGRLETRDAPDMEPIDMGMFLRQAIADEQFDLSRAGLTLTLSDGGEGRALADAEGLLRVLDNLFSNARKYAAPTSPVRLSWTREDGSFRVDMTNAIRPDAEKGTGLGLASCATILTAMGGSIDSHADGDEFRVTFRLPLRGESRP